MNATRAWLTVIFCASVAGCGGQDDGNSLSGTSLTSGWTTFGDDDDEDESGECPEGSAGCACYDNESCDEGLQCVDGTCTSPGGDGDGDGDGGDGDGDGGDGDGDDDSGDGDGDGGDGDGDSGDGDGDSGDGDGDGDAYSAVGPQTDVPIDEVVGWEVCYEGTYVDLTPLATMMSNCDGDHLMLACKHSSYNFYSVLAHAPRADVLLDQDTPPYTAHVANGTGWYFDLDPVDFGGFGFADAGDPLDTTPCDVDETNSANRLCWHTADGSINVGFRCGDTLWLNEAIDWERFILHRND